MSSHNFTIFPAIHLQQGQMIRFAQDNEADSSSIYSSDPVTCAKQWVDLGLNWLQIVNVDAALEEDSSLNWTIIEEICQLDIKVQYGGGIRNMTSVDRAMNAGIERMIVGTAAVENQQFMEDVIAAYGSDAIVLAIDTDDQGDLKTRGWRTTSNVDPVELGIKMRQLGLHTVIHTHISQSEAMSGSNLTMSAELAQATGLNLIVSGCIVSEDVLLDCARQPGINGAVVGKAVHTGKVDLSRALNIVRQTPE